MAIGNQNAQAIQRQNIYIACECIDMVWDEKDVIEFDHMWREGLALIDIAKSFGRPYRELWLLMIDRFEQKIIGTRPGGIWGNRMPEYKQEVENYEIY